MNISFNNSDSIISERSISIQNEDCSVVQKEAIEKNDDCDHMSCIKCHYDFVGHV